MSRGLPSMTALLGLLAIAGYQNRDKIAEMLGGAAQDKPGASGQGGQNNSLATGHGSGLGGLLGQLGLGGASAWYHAGEGAGLIGATAGAIIVLLIWGAIAGRRRTTLP